MIVYSLYKHLFFNYCARAGESQTALVSSPQGAHIL